jgi:hypothetical protein
MTVTINPGIFGGTSSVDPKLLAKIAGGILIRFNESAEINGASAHVIVTREQLAELGRQIDEAIAELYAPEPECTCVYVAADAVDARGCGAHSERRAA